MEFFKSHGQSESSTFKVTIKKFLEQFSNKKQKVNKRFKRNNGYVTDIYSSSSGTSTFIDKVNKTKNTTKTKTLVEIT